MSTATEGTLEYVEGVGTCWTPPKADLHKAGTRVQFRYCGGVAQGTIRSTRQHTINYKAFEYTITPDGAFETQIGTIDRDTVLVYATFEGEPCDFDRFEGSVAGV